MEESETRNREKIKSQLAEFNESKIDEILKLVQKCSDIKFCGSLTIEEATNICDHFPVRYFDKLFFDQKFNFSRKSSFWTKISIFDQNLNFWPKSQFLTKISIFDRISIFYQDFNFWPRFQFLTKISIFDQDFNFWPGFQFWIKIFTFDKNFNFWLKSLFWINFFSTKYRFFKIWYFYTILGK